MANSGGGLSIGVLSGRIDLDDNFTATITLSEQALDELEKRFGSTNSSAVAVAAGMLTAEAAIGAVKEVAHLAADALAQISVEGAKIAEVEQNFAGLTAQAGELGSTLLGNLRQGTHNTIDDFELMKSVNDTLTAGIKLTDEQYKTLSTGAFALAQSKGLEVKDVFDQINDALVTGRTRGVAYLAGKINITKAEEDYAAKLHTTADRLDADEKLEAARVAILDKVSSATQRLGDQQDGLDKKVEQVSVKWNNFENQLGKTIASSPVVLQAFDDIEAAITDAFGNDKEEAIAKITHAVEDLAQDAVTLTEDGIALVKFLYDWRDVLEPIGVGLGTVAAGLVAVSVGEKVVALATAFVTLNPLVLGAAAAATALYAAFEIGKWQPISDFFEKLGLEVFYHMSSAEADAAVAAHHLSDEHKAAADSAKDHAKATDNVAAALANGANQADNFGKKTDENTNKLRLSKSEMTDFIHSWESLNSIGGTYLDTLDTINPKIVDSVKYYAGLGIAVADLQKAFPELTKAQAEAAVAGAKAALDLEKVWDETFKIIASSHGNNINDWIKEENRRETETVSLLVQQGKATSLMLDAELAKHNATVDAELQKRAEGNDQTRAYYQKQYDDAKNNYDLLTKLGSDATAESVRNAREEMNEKERDLEHWRATAFDKTHAVGDAMNTLAAIGNKAFDSIGDAVDAMNEGLDASKIKVRELDGEVVTLDEAIKRLDQGGSQEVTSANFADMLQQFITDGGLNKSGFGISQYQDPYALAKKGYSFQEVIQYGFSPSSGPLPPPKGPRIPGFRDGGIGDFGEGTLAVLHGPEMIVPLDKAPKVMGGDTYLTFNVNGTGVQVANQIKDIWSRELRSDKQFPGQP